MKNAIARFTLLMAAATAGVIAQENPMQPILAGRQWVKAEPFFTSTTAAPASQEPATRAFRTGPAFALDSPVRSLSGKEWSLTRRLHFAIETAAYTPSRYRMAAVQDTATAVRFEFRF